MERRSSGPLAAALLCGLLAALPGCGTLPQLAQPIDGLEDKAFVGRLAERDALVGVLVEDEQMLAYVCDGLEGGQSISGWFEGTRQGDSFELSPVVGTTYETTGLGSVLVGSLRENTIEGVLTLENGSRLPWTAQPASPFTAGGLFVDGDAENLTSVVVADDGTVRGLAKAKSTGWTSMVSAKASRSAAAQLPVEFISGKGRKIKKEIPLATKIGIVKPILKPQPDPKPAPGVGTLMIMVVLKDRRAVGHRYIAPRKDGLGVPTLRLTDQLLDPSRPKRALQAFMRVQTLDATGAILSTHFIDDPLSSFVEAPPEEKTREGMFWTEITKDIASFLVAVPDLKGARKVVFTRFREDDAPIFVGAVDLLAAPLKPGVQKQMLQALSATGYEASDAEHATIRNNGSSENRMDLLILAEGFQDTVIDREEFDQRVEDLLVFLRGIPIYDEIAPAMNVHTAFVPSLDSGSGDDPQSPKNTPYQSFFGCSGIERLLCLTADGQDFAYEVAEAAPGNYGQGSVDTIAILSKDTRYGGAGGAYLTCSSNFQAFEIFSHEFGHTVCGLADEYEDEYEALVESSRLKPNVSGPVNGREELKWISLVDASTAIPTETDPGGCARNSSCRVSTLPLAADGSFQTVGMYEGAGYTACGSFRPTTECQMRCYPGYFCEVCNRAYRDTFAPFAPPNVDVYVRDNSLDFGDVPSPSNVVDSLTGISVRPYHSVDIRVDAPPFDGNFAGSHENPIAGVTNQVYVTVRNRGTQAAAVPTDVALYFAAATNGAPAFPGANWSPIGTRVASVPGRGGVDTVVFDWQAPAGLAPHTCMIATLDAIPDPLPAPSGGLSDIVRNSNNITWKNLHVVNIPEITSEMSNFSEAPAPTVLQISSNDIPLGTVFTLTPQPPIAMQEVQPDSALQMQLVSLADDEVIFIRAAQNENRFNLRADLPAASDKTPFVNPFTLKIALPGSATSNTYVITITQYEFDAATGGIGPMVGGNTYEVSFE